MNELDGHFARNERVWHLWTERGVNESTELSVDFHFYATGKATVQGLIEALNDAGFKITTTETRTLLIFKGWNITATETSTWTLARLQERTKELFELAKRFDVSLEGLGAEMP